MPRRRKPIVADEATKVRIRQNRSRERREAKKAIKDESAAAGPLDLTWILRDASLAKAKRIIDRDKQRPYWLRITFAKGEGNPPCANLYPCTTFRTLSHVYYGFLFRDHRELCLLGVGFEGGRRLLTSTMWAKYPDVVRG